MSSVGASHLLPPPKRPPLPPHACSARRPRLDTRSNAPPSRPAPTPQFILSQGASKNETWQEWDKIWTINKKIIDPICGRHTGIEEDGAVVLTLEGAPAAAEASEVPRHKKARGGAGARG